MTTKLKARKFRLRRNEPLSIDEGETVQTDEASAEGASETAMTGNVDSPEQVSSETDIDAIRKEGLTGRQLRMARRIAQKHGLAVTSDFDAVRQLRARGIDPFERSSILELVVPEQGTGAPAQGAAALPATVQKNQLPQAVETTGREVGMPLPEDAAERRATEIMKIQRDLVRRRRKKIVMLFMRMAVFVLLPTILVGYYFFNIATPMYATKSEFVIQQAQAQSGATGGLGGLFQGTSMATQQDATTVQAYLTSRAAMVRLDAEEGFKSHFSSDDIDPIQKLTDDASNEEAYKLYSKLVKIGYDPTEGILKMEVIAADPETSQRFSEALISYAEEQVDQLTQRLREDQMRGALESYQSAEVRRTEALDELLRIQNEVEVLSPEGEVSAILQQISNLETRRQDKVLELATLENVSRPNQGRVNAVKTEIASLEGLIAELRGQMTETTGNGSTLAAKTTELRLAEENYSFQTVLVQQALTMMETARLEANRQVRYLSLGVEPIAPDDATYPKAFENTLVAFLIFSGIYLMISLTASILREQVTG